MAAMAQMQNALRAEIRDLKQKIVSLETAEADNSRLRKELSNIQASFEDQKAKQELDFFNRLADIERKNNSRVVDLESKLAEHTKHLLGPAQDFKALHGAGKAEELEHKRDLSRNVDSNKHEVDVLQNQLRAVQTKRDELTRRLEEASIELELKDRKLESLGVDVSFDSTSKTSDGVILAEHRSLQRKLQEANERIACLQTGTSTASRMDGEQQRRVEKLERENLRLQSAFQKAEEDRRKHDITVLQLERRNHDLKMCLQKLEIQGQNDDTDTRASYGFTDDGNLEVECQQLHSELQKAKIALDMANLKTEELSYELRKANTANVECSPEVDMLQQQNQSLQIACNRLGGEVDELKNQLLKSGEQNSSLMTEIINVKNLLQSSEQDKKKLCEQLTKYRDSEVGRDLERERTNADRVPSNFHQKKGFDTLPSEKDTTHELLEKVREENRKLNSDVNQLQRKLDNERKLARSLRREFGDLRTSDCTVTSSSSPPMTETLHRKSKPPDGASTRGSVKGIAARFENGGFQAQPEEKIPRTSFSKMDQEEPASLSKQLAESSEEVKRLKRDLETERKQVFELEEELTRQCEINGSLLKEIKDLSLEIEAKRKECTKYFKISLQSKKDHEEIAELTSKLANLSQELTIVSKEKADLDLKHEVSKEKIISLQDQVQNNANDLNRTHSRDKETINRQEEKVKSLESDLAKTLTLVEDLRDKLNSRAEWRSNDHDFDVQNLKSTLEAKENKISQMEREKQQIVMSMKSMTGFRKEEIEELQIELARLKSKNKEQAREMELLRDQPGQGHFNLHSTANSDENTASLRAENIDLRQKLVEATAERQHAETKLKQYLNDRGGCSKSVQILRERNAALKFEVEKLTKKLSKLHGDKMQVTRVMI